MVHETKGRRILSIAGHEPTGSNLQRMHFAVGAFGVTAIKSREENYGDHGLLWFDVWTGDWLSASVSGRAVAEIRYGQIDPDEK